MKNNVTASSEKNLRTGLYTLFDNLFAAYSTAGMTTTTQKNITRVCEEFDST